MDPYIGQITLFGGTFAPLGWAFCDGQLLPISQYDALFSLIGTIYGGDGQTNFALPDLRSRVPIHQGQGAGLSNRVIGQTGGQEQVTLTIGQIPSHTHQPAASAVGGTANQPGGNVWAATTGARQFAAVANASMNAAAIGSAGQNQAHENRPPYQAVNYIIAVEGIYPSRS